MDKVMFPYHTIPDGSVMYPHHFYLGLIVVGILVWRLADNYREYEPVVVMSGSLVSLFSFVTVWGTAYPVTGAIGTILGLGIATLGLAVRGVWRSVGDIQYSWYYRVAIFIGLLVAWDDALEHAFGWPTPLDLIWKISEAAMWLP